MELVHLKINVLYTVHIVRPWDCPADHEESSIGQGGLPYVSVKRKMLFIDIHEFHSLQLSLFFHGVFPIHTQWVVQYWPSCLEYIWGLYLYL